MGEDILFVTYTDRNGEIRRIISARKANRKERLLWQSFVNP
ncbi:MAG: BrnT family toxin [Methylovirgula sp.]